MPAKILKKLYQALTEGALQAVDLSNPLTARTPMIGLPAPFESAPGFSLTELSHYDERGVAWYWNSFVGSEHMGTHFDAPIHWITGRDGEDVSQISPGRLIGPIVVVDRRTQVQKDHDYLLDVGDVRALEPLPDGGWLLMQTGWSDRHRSPEAFLNNSHWPGVTVDCARYIAEETTLRGYGSEQVGIDAGLAFQLDPPFPMHHHLLGAGKYGLASLANLGALPKRGALLVAAPLRIERGSGSPARVYALVEA